MLSMADEHDIHSLERKIDKLDVKFDGMTDVFDERWKAMTEALKSNTAHHDTAIKLLTENQSTLDASQSAMKDVLGKLTTGHEVLQQGFTDHKDSANKAIGDIQDSQKWLTRAVGASVIGAIAYALSGFPHPHY